MMKQIASVHVKNTTEQGQQNEQQARRSSTKVIRDVVKEEKGMGTMFATLAIIVIVIIAAISLWTWSQNSQTNDQQKIDAKQSQLFN